MLKNIIPSRISQKFYPLFSNHYLLAIIILLTLLGHVKMHIKLSY